MEKFEPKLTRYVSYVRLNSYLGKIGAADSEECSGKRGKETVDHFLFRCGRWSITRATHKIREGYLLGGWSGEGKDGKHPG